MANYFNTLNLRQQLAQSWAMSPYGDELPMRPSPPLPPPPGIGRKPGPEHA